MKSDNATGRTLIVGLIAVVFVLMGIDAMNGKTRYFNCQVTNHRYVPESTSTDDDGDTTTSPEEFHLGCLSTDGVTLDVHTSRDRYNGTQDGDHVWVRTREGWSGCHYWNTIVDQPPNPER